MLSFFSPPNGHLCPAIPFSNLYHFSNRHPSNHTPPLTSHTKASPVSNQQPPTGLSNCYEVGLKPIAVYLPLSLLARGWMSFACHYCGRLGYWNVVCPHGLLCFRCRRPGHIAKFCHLLVERWMTGQFSGRVQGDVVRGF